MRHVRAQVDWPVPMIPSIQKVTELILTLLQKVFQPNLEVPSLLHTCATVHEVRVVYVCMCCMSGPLYLKLAWRTLLPTLQPDTRSSRQGHKVTSCIPPPRSLLVTHSPHLLHPQQPSTLSVEKKKDATKLAAVSQLSAEPMIYERKCLVVHLWLKLSVRAKTNRCSAGSVQPPQRHIQTHEEEPREATAECEGGVILGKGASDFQESWCFQYTKSKALCLCWSCHTGWHSLSMDRFLNGSSKKHILKLLISVLARFHRLTNLLQSVFKIWKLDLSLWRVR